VTFTLFRAPVTIVYLVQGRLLNLLVRLGIDGDAGRVARIRRGIELAGLVAVLLAGVTGWLAGPSVVSLLYGDAFRPEPLVAALAATGVAGAALRDEQLAEELRERRTASLARRWAVGLVVAIAVLLVVPPLLATVPAVTVAAAFAAGELSAAAMMTRRSGARTADGPPGDGGSRE